MWPEGSDQARPRLCCLFLPYPFCRAPSVGCTPSVAGVVAAGLEAVGGEAPPRKGRRVAPPFGATVGLCCFYGDSEFDEVSPQWLRDNVVELHSGTLESPGASSKSPG